MIKDKSYSVIWVDPGFIELIRKSAREDWEFEYFVAISISKIRYWMSEVEKGGKDRGKIASTILLYIISQWEQHAYHANQFPKTLKEIKEYIIKGR